jgi:hypothetical protein
VDILHLKRSETDIPSIQKPSACIGFNPLVAKSQFEFQPNDKVSRRETTQTKNDPLLAVSLSALLGMGNGVVYTHMTQ